VSQSSPLQGARPTPQGLIEAEHDRLIAALKVSRAGTWRWDIADDVVQWDDALCEVYGITRERAPTCSRAFLALVHPDDRASVIGTISASIQNGIEADFEFRVVVGDTVRWIYDRSNAVRDADGTPTHMLGACLDVTGRRRVEQERDELLEKHTVLLQELIHRTKNHLTMVISLLRLKASRQTDATAKQDFERAIERIHTIAFLHEHLYRRDVFDRIDIHSYLDDICANLEASLLLDPKIVLIRELQRAELHIDQATPLGLIVNKVITNAAKYAFDPGKPGKIVVRFRKRDDRSVLTISDNGRGLSRGSKMQGVGTKIIRSLAKQIGARLRMVSRNGLTYSLTFKPNE
jgi:PAS domain S-box-containing protein